MWIAHLDYYRTTMSVNEAHFSVFIVKDYSVNAIMQAQKHIYLCCNWFNQCKLTENAGDKFEFSHE